MRNTMLPQKKELIYSVISMSCILGLIVLCLFLLPNGTLSWFSKNENVIGSEMGVSGEKYPLRVEYARCDAETMVAEEFSEIDPNYTLDFLESEVWYPGYSVVFKIKITNVGNGPICVNSVGFFAPAESEETARNVDGNLYYLGTQLSAEVLAIDQTTQVSPTEHRLLTLENGEPERVDLTIYEDAEKNVKLQHSDSLQLTVRLTFVNEDFSQDVYINFGKGENTTECCQRRIFVTYIPVE